MTASRSRMIRPRLALEFALRERFVQFYDGTVPFSDGREGVHEVQAVTFEQVHEAIRRARRPRLRVQRTGEFISFNGMLDSLMRWARAEGLLRGQRNRGIEPLLRKFRNRVAHGGYHLLLPGDAARAISDVAEIINHLLGAPTPGGRSPPGADPARHPGCRLEQSRGRDGGADRSVSGGSGGRIRARSERATPGWPARRKSAR